MKKCLCMPERPASGLRQAEEGNLGGGDLPTYGRQ